MWLKSAKSKTCHVLITFEPSANLDTIYILLDMLLKEDLIVNVNYHKTTHVVAFYITASYERFYINSILILFTSNHYYGIIKAAERSRRA